MSASSIFSKIPAPEPIYENDSLPLFHEACVFVPGNDAAQNDRLFMTSNLITDAHTNETSIRISLLELTRDGSPVRYEDIKPANVPMANGGVNYTDGIVFCAQGSHTEAAGLALMETDTYDAHMLVSSFEGKRFTSPNDVVPFSDGSLIFTDPIYGAEQGFRPQPTAEDAAPPNQVYRYDPHDDSVTVIATGFGRPNGVALNPSNTVLYVTDTDQVHGDGDVNLDRAADIIAFDINKNATGLFLENRRLFARAKHGIPDGIKCDVQGNVYSGCEDGVNIWSPQGGDPAATIPVPGGVANLCFGRNGTMYMANEHKLWRVRLPPELKGALLGI